MGIFSSSEDNYESIEFKPLYKTITDVIVPTKNYMSKKYQVMFYDFCNEEFLMMSTTGFVFVYKGKIIFDGLDEGNALLFWIWDIIDERYLYRNSLHE